MLNYSVAELRIICRMPTKARMIEILTLMAVSDLSTEESIAIPCSVKANGAYWLPPFFEMPIWHTILFFKLLKYRL